MEIGYTIVRAYVWEKGGGCAGQYRVCKCVPYLGLLICLPGTCRAHCSWDFIKKNVIFAWSTDRWRGRERGMKKERERDEEKGRGEGEVETRQTACHTQLKLT